MAQKQNRPNVKGNTGRSNPAPAANARPAGGNSNSGAVQDSFIRKNIQFFIVAGIALLTYLCYKACLDNKLTNWDDLGYIINNALIKDTSPDAIKNIFSTAHPVMGNYHPITILLYYFEYAHYGLEPWIYHFDSVLLHILVTIAVYFFIKALTGRTVAATVVALLFGLHPMHVESVAWAAGRKDILYGLFFILACITHVYYIRTKGTKKIVLYVAGIILFGLSLLSKAVAVTLPVTFFLIDYFENRQLFPGLAAAYADKNRKGGLFEHVRFNYWIVVEKLPHLAMALLFGMLAKQAQDKVGATTLDVHFNVLERFALGCYALCTYLWKAVVPVGLSNFYPYPLKEADALPVQYYVYPAIVIGLAFVIWKFARKNKPILFGVAFFLVNIVLLLQFIPVGGAIVSDRYGYIPYLGLFFIAGWYISGYFEVREKIPTGKVLLGIVVGYCLVLGYLTSERCKVWYDSVTLWKDDIAKHPEAPVGYFYLGQEYFTRYEGTNDPVEKKALGDSSLANFNLSVQRKPDYINPIICIAELQRDYGQIDQAKQTYEQALKINDKNESVYLGLGVVYAIKKQYDSSGYAFRKALALKPFLPEGYANFANFLDITGKTDSSLAMYAVAISQNPDAMIPYLNRGRIYARLNRYGEAIKDLNTALEKAAITNASPGEIDYVLAKTYFMKGDKAQAVQYLEKAREAGYPQIDPNFVQQLK